MVGNLREDGEMIYVVTNAHGTYEDYRTDVLFYSTDKRKANEWCELAMEHARVQDEKYTRLMRKLNDDLDETLWGKIFDSARKVKSKYDKHLDASNLGDVVYRVVALRPLPAPFAVPEDKK